MILVLAYLFAIVAANLLIARFGAGIAGFNSFLFIGLDLTARDSLHEAWNGKSLVWKMGLLIGAGSILSALFNWQAARIAIASFAAFSVAGLGDSLTYAILGEKTRFVRVNGSNIISAALDSLIFPIIAFGYSEDIWGIILIQFSAKVLGGFLWSFVLRRGK